MQIFRTNSRIQKVHRKAMYGMLQEIPKALDARKAQLQTIR